LPVTTGSVTGRAVVQRETVHVHDLAAEPEDELPVGRDLQRRFGHHTMLATPLLREGIPLGAIALFRTEIRPFSDRQLELVKTFADQAVIAIDNVRLFQELQTRNAALSEALEQQTATGEVLKVISRSTVDLDPVLQTVVESATRLCGAVRGHIFRVDGDFLRFAAAYGAWPGFREYLEQNPVPVGPGSGGRRRASSGPHPGHPGRSELRVRRSGEAAGLPHGAGGAHPARGRVTRSHRDPQVPRRALHRQADRAGDHLRGPSRDRDRERAAPHRAAVAQPRPDGAPPQAARP